MAHQMHKRWGEENAHPVLKTLILTTLGISLLSAFLPALQPLLALSLSGMGHFFLWQPLTYLLLHPSPQGISFPFLVHLAFNMYLLWTFGSFLLQRTRPSLFLTLYFGSGLFSAALSLTAMLLFDQASLLAGSSSAIYALLIAWIMFNPEAHLLLFFALPFKAIWLVLGLIGANLLIDLANADWVHFADYLGGILFGYFFTLLVWKERSPFSFLSRFEKTLLRMLEKLSHLGKKKTRSYRNSKIFDIQSGDPVLDDEQFMDAMLSQISLHGEHSLTSEEKKRMKKISARKASEKR